MSQPNQTQRGLSRLESASHPERESTEQPQTAAGRGATGRDVDNRAKNDISIPAMSGSPVGMPKHVKNQPCKQGSAA